MIGYHGLFSAVTKPAVGLFDFASNLTEGISFLDSDDAMNLSLAKAFVTLRLH